MPAPTALQRVPDAFAEDVAMSQPTTTPITPDGDAVLLDATEASIKEPNSEDSAPSPEPAGEEGGMDIDVEGRPRFKPAKQRKIQNKSESRKVRVPPHRLTPLKGAWPKIYPPLVEHLFLQVRMNLKDQAVELRTSKKTTDPGALQKGADFIRAFSLGFDVDDAIALLRLDDLYIETFEIKDVKTLQGEHLSRAIGRIAGKDGKTKFAIENTTKTRIVLADQKIHILGGFQNGKMAREAVVSLILGSPPGKVYGNLRTVAARQKERF